MKRAKHESLQSNRYDWEFRARPEQLEPPGDWLVWFLRAGRAFGKTRAGSEWVRKQAFDHPGVHIGLMGRTLEHVLDVQVYGRSGIINISPPWFRPRMDKKTLVWPNGSTASLYSSHSPNALRGPQHEKFWGDEVATWRNLQECVDSTLLNMRDGRDPRILYTTTPRPIPRLVKLQEELDTVVVTGSTYDNMANLPHAYIELIRRRFEGTRMGLQEIYAQQLMEAEHALWRWAWIEDHRILDKTPAFPETITKPWLHVPISKVIVALDPAVTSDEETSDEHGLVVVGRGIEERPRGYVLEDDSGIDTPKGIATRAVSAYHRWRARGVAPMAEIVAEANNGGDWIESVLRSVDPAIPYRKVHASIGKFPRAEPISAIYEQQLVSHMGTFPELETELVGWEPGDPSPSRLDALVWGLTALDLVDDAPAFEAFVTSSGLAKHSGLSGYHG